MAEKKNLEVLRSIMLKGDMVKKGTVLAKSDFDNKSDWQNLCHMESAGLAETDKPVGVPKEQKKAKADALPGV